MNGLSGRIGTRFRLIEVDVPGPIHRVCRHRGRERPLIELTFGAIEAVSTLDETQGETSGSGPVGIRGRCVEVTLVTVLEFDRKPFDLAPVERREPATNREAGGAMGPGGTEPAGPLDGTSHGTVAASLVAESELASGVGEVELSTLGVGIEETDAVA